MAVPKRKTGRARTHSRRSPQCGAVKLPHRVCGNCGYYNKREVIEVE